MTHISRKKLPPQIEKDIRSALKSVFINLSRSDVDKIINFLITETEQLMMAKRLTCVLMLMEGATYKEISKSLNLTEQTITGINFEINKSPREYKYLSSKLTPWKRKQLFKSILKELGLHSLKMIAKHSGGRIY